MSPTATRKPADDPKVDAPKDSQPKDSQPKADNEKGVLGDAVVQPSMPIVETVEDRQGVPRIVNTYTDGWEPAPLEASEEEIKAAKDLAERREQETKDGLEALDAKRKNHADNKASDAGDDA